MDKDGKLRGKTSRGMQTIEEAMGAWKTWEGLKHNAINTMLNQEP